MKHYIDPKIDCVFKAILGALGREHLLVHFINAVVKLRSPIVSVTIENPYVERHQIDAKLNIVDIRAKDENKRSYQIEMQLTSPAHLISRMTQNLSQIHSQQARKGDNYTNTKEAIAIWLLTNDIGLHKYPNVSKDAYQFHFQMYEKAKNIDLPNSTHLHIVQMNRWHKPKKSTMQPLDYWIYFFMKGNRWQHLPEDACIPEIKEAMTVLEEFASDPEKYEYYRTRRNIQLAEQSIEAEHKQIREERDLAFNRTAKLVKNLLANKTMTIEQIAKITGFSIEEINDLR